MAGEVLPYSLYTAAGVRAIDRRAIDGGVPGIVLMERAAAFSFEVLRERWPEARTVAVVCGVGNNGGDGLVLARLAAEAGFVVTAVLVGDPRHVAGEAAIAHRRCLEAGVPLAPYDGSALAPADVLVDALLGTGLTRPVDGLHAAAIAAMNAAPGPCLSIDIPTGLHADTGQVLGACVQASVTTTFIALKQGLFTGRGRAVCASVRFADLGVAADALEAAPVSARRVDAQALARHLPRRARDAHKGRFGHVLVIGGDLGYAGAGLLCAQAAGRSGAGLVSLATREAHAALAVLGAPEVMARAVEDRAALGPLMARASVLALGPGLGATPWSRSLFEACVEERKPTVVDADGLNWLARLGGRRDDWVLTPHPGEAARLLGVTVPEVEADRIAAAREIAARFGGTCLLKGAGTVVVGPAGCAIVTTGNPGMAAGGSGDVLTGVVAALMAQGLSPQLAAELGACAHGHAGDLAAEGGERGLLARDIIEHLRAALNPC